MLFVIIMVLRNAAVLLRYLLCTCWQQCSCLRGNTLLKHRIHIFNADLNTCARVCVRVVSFFVFFCSCIYVNNSCTVSEFDSTIFFSSILETIGANRINNHNNMPSILVFAIILLKSVCMYV